MASALVLLREVPRWTFTRALCLLLGTAAALTVALVEGQDPETALAFACAAGAAAATKMGAQPSLPTRQEVLALL